MKREQKLTYTMILIPVTTGSTYSLSEAPCLISSRENSPFKAALIDEVAVTNPGPYLVSNATSALTRVDYAADYYGLKNVTVNLVKTLLQETTELSF